MIDPPGARPYSRLVPQDTSPEQLLRHAEFLRAMSPVQRARALRAVDGGVRRMVMIRLRRRFPDSSERELIIRQVAAVHGRAVARRVYGTLPANLDG